MTIVTSIGVRELKRGDLVWFDGGAKRVAITVSYKISDIGWGRYVHVVFFEGGTHEVYKGWSPQVQIVKPRAPEARPV